MIFMYRRLNGFLKRLCGENLCIDNWIFRFVGVKPHDREFRDHVDWLYLLLWMSSVIYQWLIWICFLFYPDSPLFISILEDMFDPYIMAVGGYGIFNIFHRYHIQNRRFHNVEISKDKRKERNGHRFIRYWWINFAVMFFATLLFDYDNLTQNMISGPMRLSKKIAITCMAIGFGYWMAKWKWNNLGKKDNPNPLLWLMGIEKK